MTLRTTLQRAIRPSTTAGTAALWAKSLLNAALFFAVFMVALPWAAHRILPLPIPIPAAVGTGLAAVLAIVGLGAWIACLDVFSRRGRGTPFPGDAPRELVTTGLFGRVRNPIMAGELMVVWAEALHIRSLGVLLYAVLLSLGAHLAAVYVEEPELRARFGARYEEYCRNVPRWLPAIGRRRASPPPEQSDP